MHKTSGLILELTQLRAEIARLKRRRYDSSVAGDPDETQCVKRYNGYSKPNGYNPQCILIDGHSGTHTDDGYGTWVDEECLK